MNIRYDKKDDILMIKVSEKNIDYAKEAGDIIIHYSKNDEPVLLEVMDASKFLAKTKAASR